MKIIMALAIAVGTTCLAGCQSACGPQSNQQPNTISSCGPGTTGYKGSCKSLTHATHTK